MNIFLSIKNKKHGCKYYESMEYYTAQSLYVQVIMGASSIIFILYNQISLMVQPVATQATMNSGISRIVFFFLLLMMGLIARLLRNKLQKYHKISRLGLDIINIGFSGYMTWIISQNTSKPYYIGWWDCLVALSIVACISRWYLKILAFFTMILMAFLNDPGSIRMMLILAAILIYYAFSTYFLQRYEISQFLEKQKLYEETQTFKQMLDLTTDGIIIYSFKEEMMYKNWEDQRYSWWSEKQNPEQNLMNIKIEKRKNIFDFTIFTTSPDTLNTLYESRRGVENEDSNLVEILRTTVKSFDQAFISQLHNDQQTHYLMSLTGKLNKNRDQFTDSSFLQDTANSNCVLEIRVIALTFREQPALALIFHDITERNTIAILEDNNNYKNRLLASVSHELRTPLNASINFIQAAIDDRKLPESIRENLLLPSLASNQLLLFLINDILDFSQMGENKLRLVYESADVKKTVDDCLNLVKIQAKRKELSLNVEYQIEPETSELCTDHNRLKQIILNLLSNAIKFTLEGGITVKARLTNSPEDRKLLHVQVSDTGIGISEADQQKLFQAFVKIDLGKRLSLNSTGVGLGLMISNNLAQMLGPAERGAGSSIKVKSELNKGSMFEFWIIDQDESSSPDYLSPNKSFHPEDHAQIMNEHIGSVIQLPHHSLLKLELRSKRSSYNPQMEATGVISLGKQTAACSCPQILVVDDDVFNITALQTILNGLGYSSQSAYNGQQAIKKVFERQEKNCGDGCHGQYRLIFMDCNMPVLDGFEATKELKRMIKQNIIPQICIIGCTALVQSHERQKALSAGMDECCTKPLNRTKIDKLLRTFLKSDS